MAHTWQKWNNCGPSSVLMAISAFGPLLDQLAVADELKPDREDTNVTPGELAAFARSQGLHARVRYGGDIETARALVQAGVPLIAEQWIDVDGRGEMGHYRVVIGYDDTSGELIAHDSYYGPSRRFSYAEFERMWRPFVGAYVAVYRDAQAADVRAAVGDDWDDAAMWSRLLADREAWTAAEPNSAWAWFTLGEVRDRLGDHAGAVEAFERAIAIGLPTRAFWYQFGYYRSLVATGAYARAVAHADATIETMNGENLEESHYWRAVALERLGQVDAAAAGYRRALEFNPLYAPARAALEQLGAPAAD